MKTEVDEQRFTEDAMLGVLLVKEMRAHALSYRFALALLLLFGLIVGSVLLLALGYQRQVSRFSASQRAQEERLRSAEFRQVMGDGVQGLRRPSPLSVLAVGLEPEMARAVTISIYGEPRVGRRQYANPLYGLFPTPDLVFIVNVVVSLLALLFAFDAVAGESEAGTLRLLLAYAVPRHQVLLAKWLGGYLALIVPFVLAVLTGLGLARVTLGLPLSGPEWAAVGVMLGVAMLYSAVFFSLGLMISTWVHRAAASLVISFLVWVALVLAVPNLAPLAARALAPAPSAGVLAGQREALIRELTEEQNRLMRQRQPTSWEAMWARYHQENDRLQADYQQRVTAQIALGVALSRLSPSASYVHAAVGLAGNGWRDFVGLRQASRQGKKAFDEQVEAIRSARQRQLPEGADEEERRQLEQAPVGPQGLPVFAPGRSGVAEALEAGHLDLLLLALLNGVFFLGAYRGFLRYDLMG